MRLRMTILLAVTGIALTACTPEGSDSAIDLNAEAEAVNETSLSWLAHARAKDAAAIADLFTDDGVLFWENQEPVVGPTAIEAYLTRDFEENPDQDPDFGSDRIVVAASGDLAVEFGTWGSSGPDADYGKYITVYRKVDDVWKVAGDMALSTKAEEESHGDSTMGVFANPDKGNILYIGVENPVTLQTVGVAPSDLSVSITGGGGQIREVQPGHYIVTVAQPGEAVIDVTGGGVQKKVTFRVRRIPDPIARLSNSSGGPMGTGEFKAQTGVIAVLSNFDFEATCLVTGFNLVAVARRADPVEVTNAGARFNTRAKSLVSRARSGDIYYFHNVRVRCPGDSVSREVNSMVFMIQ